MPHRTSASVPSNVPTEHLRAIGDEETHRVMARSAPFSYFTRARVHHTVTTLTTCIGDFDDASRSNTDARESRTSDRNVCSTRNDASIVGRGVAKIHRSVFGHVSREPTVVHKQLKRASVVTSVARPLDARCTSAARRLHRPLDVRPHASFRVPRRCANSPRRIRQRRPSRRAARSSRR